MGSQTLKPPPDGPKWPLWTHASFRGPDQEVYFPQEHPPGREAQFDFTHYDNYAALLDHYGLRSTRINRGQSHENGVAEQGHYRLKDAVDQALILRGSRDFHTADDYAGFVQQMVEKRNRLVKGKLEQEVACLQPLPPAPMPEYVNYQSRVRKWSTIQVAGHSYSVPSRLIGKEVQIRLYSDWVEVYYKGHLVEGMARVRGEGESNVNYRHVIGSLVRKP